MNEIDVRGSRVVGLDICVAQLNFISFEYTSWGVGDYLFYLVRHGEADCSEIGTKIYQGHGENLISLPKNGIEQVLKTSKDSKLHNCDFIISSPYTRAIHTAAILSKELQIDIIIETNLHEWQADKLYNYLSSEERGQYCNEFNIYNGFYPEGQVFKWEDNHILKNRLHSVLRKYNSYNKVIVVCHGMLIHSVYQDVSV